MKTLIWLVCIFGLVGVVVCALAMVNISNSEIMPDSDDAKVRFDDEFSDLKRVIEQCNRAASKDDEETD